MNRVVYIVPGNVYGGAHNQIAQVSVEAKAAGIEILVLLPREEGDAGRRLAALGIEVRQVDMSRIRASKYIGQNLMHAMRLPLQIWRLRELIRSLDVTVVQVHGITQFDIALAARLAGVGLVWQLLDTRAPALLMRILRVFLLRLPHAIMATGKRTLNMHVGTSPVDVPTYYYIPPIRDDLGQSSGEAQGRRGDVRQRLGVADGDVLVVSIGNLNPQKGHEHLLRAVGGANIRSDVPIKLRIRGGRSVAHEDYLSMLQATSTRLNLGEGSVCEFEEWLSVPSLMRAADIFVLASEPRSEGIPTVLLEAMTLGVPVLSANVGSVPEIIRDNVDGLLHESRDDQTLGEQIRTLSNDGGRRQELSTAALARAAELQEEPGHTVQALSALSEAAKAVDRGGDC